MKIPKYWLPGLQAILDVGLNGFAVQLMAESFADVRAKFGDENVIFQVEDHNHKPVYFIMTKEQPTLDDFVDQHQISRLRAAILNQCADNMCWLEDPKLGKALPEAEFLESCRRYRAQIAEEKGELVHPGRMTIAQLEARVLELEIENEKLRAGFAESIEAREKKDV